MGVSRSKTIFLGLLFTGSALAGTGIATSTFTIPNSTGSTATNLNVVLTNPPDSISSLAFPNVSSVTTTFDFSGGTVASGANDEIVAQKAFSGVSPDVALGLESYYWTDSGQQEAVNTPLSPVVDEGLGPSVFELSNTTNGNLMYSQLNLTIDGTPVLSNSSGTVTAGGTQTIYSGGFTYFHFTYQDVATGVTEDLTFTPEPGTLVPAALLVAGLAWWRMRRRAQA